MKSVLDKIVLEIFYYYTQTVSQTATHTVAMAQQSLLLALCLVLGASCVAGQATPQKPHLILIVADDLGWNDVSWNNPGVVSPNLGKLASEGMILNNSYVQPICSPTRSALLASRYPFTIGRQGAVITPLQPTGLTLNATILPQELQDLGYDTHIVGKWHLGFCKWEYTPTYRGFDSFYGYYTGSEDYYVHTRGYSSFVNVTEGDSVLEDGYDFRNDTSVNRAASGHYSAFLFSDHVDYLLRSRNPAKPLFLYVPFQSVHTPLQVPDNYSDIYKNISDHDRRIYLGMVSALDDAVGRIITSLKNTGHYNNSIIVFTADNGGPTVTGANNWPLRGNKTTLWEGGTRGSAFIHSPMLANPGTVSNRLIHVTDWYPTFVRLAGGAAPPGIDGVDQWEALNNKSLPDARDYFVYDLNQANGMSAAVRWGRYKLIVGDPGPSSWTPPPDLQYAHVGHHTNDGDRKAKIDFPENLESFIYKGEGSKLSNANRDMEESMKKETLKNKFFSGEELERNRLDSDSQEFNGKNNFLQSRIGKHNLGRPNRKYNHVSVDAFISPGKRYISKNMDNQREDSAEDSNENSIFSHGKSKSSKLNRHSQAFIQMALKYLKNKHIDAETILSPGENYKTQTEDGVSNVEDLLNHDTEFLLNLAQEKGDKFLHRELKRRHRLSSGVSLRLSDFESVQDLIDANVDTQLYDVIDDPTERVDLAKSEEQIVELMLARLYEELPRYVAPDVPPNDSQGKPENFDGAWSPGWC